MPGSCLDQRVGEIDDGYSQTIFFFSCTDYQVNLAFTISRPGHIDNDRGQLAQLTSAHCTTDLSSLHKNEDAVLSLSLDFEDRAPLLLFFPLMVLLKYLKISR